MVVPTEKFVEPLNRFVVGDVKGVAKLNSPFTLSVAETDPQETEAVDLLASVDTFLDDGHEVMTGAVSSVTENRSYNRSQPMNDKYGTLTVHVTELLLVSAYLTITLEVPTGNTPPDVKFAGVVVIVTAICAGESRLSVAFGIVKLIRLPPGKATTGSVKLVREVVVDDGQATVGGTVSTTVTVKLHQARLPDGSRTPVATAVAPRRKTIPEAVELAFEIGENIGVSMTVVPLLSLVTSEDGFQFKVYAERHAIREMPSEDDETRASETYWMSQRLS